MSFFKYREKETSKKFNNVLAEYSEGISPEVIFLTSTTLDRKRIEAVKIYMEQNFGYINYKLIYVFDKKMSDQDIKKNIKKYEKNNVIDLSQYINSNTPVIALGMASRIISGNSDLHYYTFIDYEFNNTYYFHPKYKCNVYPASNVFSYYPMDDCFELWHFKYQLDLASTKDAKYTRGFIPTKILVEDPNDFLKLHLESKKVAWDIETSGFDFTRDKIVCLTVSFDGKTGYYMRWKDIDKNLLSRFFENKFQIGANLKFDCKFLTYNGVSNVKIDFDSWHAGHVLNEIRSNSLKTHSWIYTKFGGYDDELEEYKSKYKKITYDQIPERILFPYATMDAIVNFQVYEKMSEQIKYIDSKFYKEDSNWKLSNYYYDVIVPALNLAVDMEMHGMCINWERVKEAAIELQNKISDIKQQIANSFGIEEKASRQSLFDMEDDIDDSDEKDWKININSNIQIGRILKDLGWTDYGLSKNGDYLVNEETLNNWSKEGHKEADLIKELHSVSTIHKTFVGFEKKNNGVWQYRLADNKIHPNFGIMVADSGRNTCKNPNLQNIPKRGNYSNLIRSFYSPPSDEYLIGEFDAAGFQLRICAALSGDENMTYAFTDLGGDLHSKSAQAILKRDVTLEEFLARKSEKEFKKKRFQAKGINFSLIFNTSAMSFASAALVPEWTEEECDDYLITNSLSDKPSKMLNRFGERDSELTLKFCKYWAVAVDIKKKFFQEYPAVKTWIESQISIGEKLGYVISAHGCIRRLPQLKNKGKDTYSRTVKNLQNITCNTVVQNFEIVRIMTTTVKLHNYIKENNLKTKIVNTVHDSIILYIHKDELDIIKKQIKKIFEELQPEDNGVPMEIEGDIANYYAEFGSDYYYEYEKDGEKKIADHRYWGSGIEIKVW